MNKYTTDEIVSNREQFETDVQKTLSKTLVAEGFQLDQLTSGLKYPKTIVDAINKKNTVIQDGMRVQNEINVIRAQAKKDSIKSRAYANNLLIEAAAEADANRIKQQTLTPMIIQQQFIDKWNGSTPLYGNSPMLLKGL